MDGRRPQDGRRDPEKSRLKVSALLFALSLLILAAANLTPYPELLELKAYDLWMAYLRGPRPAPDDLVIVAIDEDSLTFLEEERNAVFPWPRSVHAELIDALQKQGPAAVVFDVTFSDSSPCRCTEEETAPEDLALAESISRSPVPIVLGAFLDRIESGAIRQERLLRPLQLFRDAGAFDGFVNLNRDRQDDVVRRGPLSVNQQPTLVTRTLEVLGRTGWKETVEDAVYAYEGQQLDPTILINFTGGPRHIQTYSYYQAMEPEIYLPKVDFRGKIVLVGRSLAVADLSGGRTEADLFASPFTVRQDVRVSMPGVEVHANILHTLLREDYLYQTRFSEGLLTLGLALLVGVVVLFVNSLPWRVAISVLLLVGYATLGALSFLLVNTSLYMVNPLLAAFLVFGLITLYDYSRSEKERAQIRRALEGYVSPQVMGQVLRNPEALALGGTQVEATVLFSDISGFSKISEEISAPDLAELLNHYFTMMGDVIMSRNGMIDKYIGDAIMAIWGAPLPDPQHPLLACRAALEMKRIIDESELGTRIGINTGTMVAGNMGHRRRMEYTVIGDAVNLASRLEGANKAFGSVILVSESTEREVRDEILCRPVASIRVVGRDRPAQVFEVLGERDGDASNAIRDLVDSFQQVREIYLDRRWQQAVEACEAHLERFPDDQTARTYLERCRSYVRQPPPPDWDGVWEMETK